MIQEGDLAAQSGRAKQERVGHLNYNTYLASISRNRIAEVKESDYAVGGKTLTAADVHGLQQAKAA